MQKKRVLVLASTFPRWKNDTTPPFVFELEKRLAKDFEIFLLAPHFVGAKKKENLEGIKVQRFQYFWPAKYQKLCYEGGIMPNIKKNKLLVFEGFTLVLFEFIAAFRIVRREKIDLIHAHWIIPQGFVAVALKKILGVPYIVTTHGGDIFGLKGGAMRKVKKVVLENAKRITVVSNAIKDEILKNINPKLNVDVISMGVDSKLFNPDKYDKSIKDKYKIDGPFLLFVGRLAEKKGVSYLLQAMPAIINKFPNVKLLIIGEGALENQLKSLVLDLGIDKNVIFVGGITNDLLPKFYATADILVAPSIVTADGDTEGLPVSIIEGLASGTCVISTGTGGISDVIKNGENGFLVDQKNSREIKETTTKLLENKELLKKYRSNSYKSISNFDWNYIRDKYINVLTFNDIK